MADQNQPPAYALPPASWGARAGSLIVDFLIVLAIGAVIALIVYAIKGDAESIDYSYDSTGERTTDATPYWLLWGAGGGALGAFVYPWVALGLMGGRTFGRKVAGIRLVNYDGTPVSYGKGFLREVLVKGALGFFSIPLLVSYLWPLWDPHQRALHDMIMRTRAVLDTGDDTVPSSAFGDAAPAYSGSAGGFAPPVAPPSPGTPSAPPPPPPPPPPSRSDRDQQARDMGLDG